jgi:hypothetical protein
MTSSNIKDLRLLSQHLVGKKFTTPYEAVSHFGGVQSQDYFAASWSLGQRIENATDKTIDEAFNQGKILRTHVMRPTWHFVAPEDIRWMQELTSPRVKQFMSHYNRKLELDDKLFTKTTATIVKVLKEKTHATRQELKAALTDIGIKTDVQRLAHLVMWAELDAIICSGPRIGKQFTYALLEERAPKRKVLNREEALAELAKRYFTGHGPAQLKDFSWWSGLTVKDAQEGISMVKSKLEEETIDGKTYWYVKEIKVTKPSPKTFLLSIYDEYTIAYSDRSALGGEKYFEKIISMGNALTGVIIFNGILIGTWKRVIKKTTVEIKLSPFRKTTNQEKVALQKEAERYGKFLGLKAHISQMSS